MTTRYTTSGVGELPEHNPLHHAECDAYTRTDTKKCTHSYIMRNATHYVFIA